MVLVGSRRLLHARSTCISHALQALNLCLDGRLCFPDVLENVSLGYQKDSGNILTLLTVLSLARGAILRPHRDSESRDTWLCPVPPATAESLYPGLSGIVT